MIAKKITPQALNFIYTIDGMTCESCVKTVTDMISSIPDISSVKVNLKDKTANILSTRKIELTEVRKSLSENTKYSVSEFQPAAKRSNVAAGEAKKSILKIYKPLITVFAFILLTSLAHQFSLGKFDAHLLMNHMMAGFFIGFSFFKFLDLKEFSESFSSYDPIAQRWLFYGYTYPFIELALGLLFISGKQLRLANAGTIIVLFVTTYGVYKRLQTKSQFQCACLGTTFKLPLSNVTIAENVAMIVMALYGLSI